MLQTPSSSLSRGISRRCLPSQSRSFASYRSVSTPRDYIRCLSSTSLLSASSVGRKGRNVVISERSYSSSARLLKSNRSSSSVAAATNDSPEAIRGTNERSVEEQYSRKTPLEHVLLRPGMYVGPVERLPPNQCWVLEPTPLPPNRADESGPTGTPPDQVPEHSSPGQVHIDTPYRMVRKEHGLVPALIKIFDEILVNASDNRLRNPDTCTRIDVVIDPGDTSQGRLPFISVLNNGKGIPVQVGHII